MSTKYEFESRPSKCPSCASERVAEIWYGMGDLDCEELKDGRAVWDGCGYSAAKPAWRCLACGTEMHEKGRRDLGDRPGNGEGSPDSAPSPAAASEPQPASVPAATPADGLPRPFLPGDEVNRLSFEEVTVKNLEYDMWTRPNPELTEWDDIMCYADSVDGSEYARTVLGGRLRDMWPDLQKKALFPDMASFVDLRLWLFWRCTAWRFTSPPLAIGHREEDGSVTWQPLPQGPDVHLVLELRALYFAICDAWEREWPAKWGVEIPSLPAQGTARTGAAEESPGSFPHLPSSSPSSGDLSGEPSIPPGYSLWRRTTVAEVESTHTLPEGSSEPVQYHILVTRSDVYERWQVMKSLLQPGDELWEFSTDQESWDELAGRAGIHAVRNGEIVGTIVTMMN